MSKRTFQMTVIGLCHKLFLPEYCLNKLGYHEIWRDNSGMNP